MRTNPDDRDALIALLSHALARRRDRYVEFASRPKAQEKLLREFYHQLGNCFGHPISERDARDIVGMLSPTFDLEVVHRHFHDDLGYCIECRASYCSTHWPSSRGGYGHCPNGDGKSLDPHWSPEDYPWRTERTSGS